MNHLLKVTLLVVLCMCLLQGTAIAKECWECPKDNPCGYSTSAGDGCNTCSGSTWCENDQWYTDGLMACTLAYCIREYIIPNPFSGGITK
jgi:hypothetical protein